jgi:hypothetical protein
MSALGQKQTFGGVAFYVRFAPESGHFQQLINTRSAATMQQTSTITS